MDKSSERINRQTLEFANRVYEELSTIVSHRGGLRYFNYDNNDVKIDRKLERMFELLDDIYNSSIEKKTNFTDTTPKLQPRKIKFPEENIPELDIHTPEPRTPKKKKNIKVEIIDMDIVETPSNIVESPSDVLETIMYSSSDEDTDFETL